MTTKILQGIMAEFDAMDKDGGWEGDHPILQMAAEIDRLKKNAAAISDIVWAEEIEDAYGALNTIQGLC